MRLRPLDLFGMMLVAGACLSSLQHARAADHRLVLACNDFPPLKIEHPGSDGLRGTDVDAIAEIARRAGLDIEPRFMPWKRGYAEASEGKIDGLCSCSYRADRADLFHFSDEIGITSVGIFHAPGSSEEPFKSLADLADPDIGTVGVVKGYNLEAELEDAKIPHETVSADAHAYEMLVNRRLEHLYSFRAPIDFIARHTSEKLPVYTELRSSPYFICLSKKVPETALMLPAINKAIAAMKADGTFAEIQRRYGQAPIN